MDGWMEVEAKSTSEGRRKEGRVSQSPAAPVPFHFLGCAQDRTGMCGSVLVLVFLACLVAWERGWMMMSMEQALVQHGQAARSGQGNCGAKSGLWIRFTSHCTSRCRHHSNTGSRSGGNGKEARAIGGIGERQAATAKSGNPLRNTSTVSSSKGIKYIYTHNIYDIYTACPSPRPHLLYLGVCVCVWP